MSDLFYPEHLPDHESPLRRMMADASGQPYIALRSLDEAKLAPDSVVILEGDDGGQIYVVARAPAVHCSEEALQRLLRDLDAQEWNDPSMAHLVYERRPVGSPIAGGMGGGTVLAELWVHQRLSHLESSIAAVLRGERDAI